MQYCDPRQTEAFTEYKQKIDPRGAFNRGKLMPGSGLHDAYTPSLRLVQQEALILEASEIGELNNEIKDCLRCGKCKPVCTTHVPRASLLYSPRNKILATNLLTEAFLYAIAEGADVISMSFGGTYTDFGFMQSLVDDANAAGGEAQPSVSFVPVPSPEGGALVVRGQF